MSDSVPVPASWAGLRRFTAARIATGRAGGSLPTAEVLRFDLDHAAARDAVYAALDFATLESALAPLALPVVRVQTGAGDRLTYLQRPDLGRRLDLESRARLEKLATQPAAGSPDIVLILADGLSASAAQTHGPPLLQILAPALRAASLTLGPLVTAQYARVALQDDVGEMLAAKAALILLGERPGLAAADSLGGYFVFNPRVGNTDAQRNCVSNIRPAGLPLPAAADTLAYLISAGLRGRLSGTALKDERDARITDVQRRPARQIGPAP